MKIISWNVNGIRAAYKKNLVNFLEIQNPDVFCVQETKAHLDQLSEDIISMYMMKSYWSSAQRKGYSGVATFCKNQADEVSYGIGVDKFDQEGRFVITKHGDVTIYNIYFPNGASGKERHDFKQEFLVKLNEHMAPKIARGEKVIVLGDYNVAPTEIDIFDPIRMARTSGFLPEEREWFKQFLNIGFIDTFRHFHPDVKDKYTWWNQIERGRLTNRGWRIDMICATKNLQDRLATAAVLDEIQGSDHCPILLELKEP